MASETALPGGESTRAYENGWAAMTQLMLQGKSWSGRERNCCYLNLGDGTFANVSALFGTDFEDDGRSVAVVDWDGDGALDLWLRNRTGPQLRFLANRAPAGRHFLELKLVGHTANRDAIGARVEVRAGGQRLVREVRAGSGYLSQSSRWLHFGLGADAKIEQVTIRWPDGQRQEIAPPAPDRRYVVGQGDEPVAEPQRTVKLMPSPAAAPPPTAAARLVLRVPLPLPPGPAAALFGPPAAARGRLVVLWSLACPPCREELSTLAAAAPRLAAAGLEVVIAGTDPPEDQERAAAVLSPLLGASPPAPLVLRPATAATVALLEAVLNHVRYLRRPLPLPVSFLFDHAGGLQVVYLGPLSVETLVADLPAYGASPESAVVRSPFPGRWFYGIPRNLAGLAQDLHQRGLREEAAFYTELDRAIRGRLGR